MADNDCLGAEHTVRMIREAGGHAEYIALDVTDPASVDAAVTATVAAFGALHLAVNSAGVTGRAVPTGEYDPQDWRRVIDVDLSSVFYCLRYEIPALLLAGGGSIVNLSSVFGSNGCPQQSAYAAASTASSASPKAPRSNMPRRESASTRLLLASSKPRS